MKRNVDINEISDGKLYELNDLVKVDCNGCQGCSACCHGMGESIILDPFDIYQLTLGLKTSFEELLADAIELNVIDGVILPNLKMKPDDDQCHFLDENGRCSIHNIRPSICRLFPLGRLYANGGFKYFLQIKECNYPNKTKTKIKKWIDIPDIQKNQEFIIKWHDFITEIQTFFTPLSHEELIKKVDLFILQHFYMERYNETEDFYTQFNKRMEKAISVIATLTKAIRED